jgi:hypothetical protein
MLLMWGGLEVLESFLRSSGSSWQSDRRLLPPSDETNVAMAKRVEGSALAFAIKL